MRSGDLAKLYGVSPTTIQNWSKEFNDYLSPHRGKQRLFTEQDVITLATVAKLSADGLNYSLIKEKLQEGYRVDNPSAANFGIDTRMIPAAAVEQVIDSTEIRVALEAVTRERDKLLEQNLRYEQRLQELQGRIAELQHELGLAQGELLYRRKLDQGSEG